MKKLIVSCMTIGLLALTSVSCNKKQNNAVSVPQTKHEAALAQIQQIRANALNYKNTHKGAKTTNAVGTAVKAVVADGFGCATGFNWGGRAGAALGNPVTGAAAGAVLGAVIGSGWSLWSSWNSSPIAPPPGPPSPPWANGFNGIYQQAGYIHDISCVSLFTNATPGTTYPINVNDFCAAVSPSVIAYVSNAYNIDPSVLSSCVNVADCQNFYAHYNPDASISDNVAVISPYVQNDQNILSYTQAFFTDFTSCDPTDTADMYAFCNAYYSYISSDQSLTSTEATYLLVSVNVTQYSLALWYSNLANFGQL